MNCGEVTSKLVELLYDELSGPQRRAVEEHLEGCSVCSAEYRSLKRTQESLNQWSPADSPSDSKELARFAESSARLSKGRSDSWTMSLRPALLGAAAAVLLATGLLFVVADRHYADGRLTLAFGRSATDGTVRILEDAEMSEFVLLLYDEPGGGPAPSAEQIRQIVSEYVGWSDNVRQDGHMVGGKKFTDDAGRTLRAVNEGVTVAAGPDGTMQEVLGGFFHIRAESYEQAVAIAETCPHVAKYGQRIELREIELENK